MPQREFLGWSRPLVELAADWLWQRRETMPGMLVVVPTAQSGRLLRETLAERGPCLSPRVVTPDSFFRVEESGGTASALEERYAWIDSLRRLGPELHSLFPLEPVERSFAWAAGVSDELLSAWDALAESRRTFEDARRESLEPERWQDIARLHRRAVQRLERWGKSPRSEAKAHEATHRGLPPGTQELVVIGVPDPAPLTLVAWQRLAEEGAPVRVLIHAPENLADAFDTWGRPLPDFWPLSETPVPLEQIHLTAGAPELAEEAVKCCAGQASDEVTVGLCDPTYGPALEAAFAEAGWKIWNPEGKTAGRALAGLLRSLAALGLPKPPPWPEVAATFRNPLLAAVLGTHDFFPALVRLDELEEDYLPENLERLSGLVAWRLTTDVEDTGLKRLREIAEWIAGWQELFSSGAPAEALAQWIHELRDERKVEDGAAGRLYELLEAALPALDNLQASGLNDPAEAVELALTGSDGLRSLDGREDSVLDLPGWLELSFEKAPRMILAGLHEGAVPDGRLDDAFLPDNLRLKLELRSAASRHARDAFLLRSFAESRRVEILVAKIDPQGEPRRPSRLLLAAKGRELAERVRQLSGQPAAPARRLSAWRRGPWLLEFDQEPRLYLDGQRKLSPSALRDYLYCPFRFYLKRVLKWERYEAGKLEMNPRDFGNVCHRAFENMGRSEAMRSTVDAKELADYLIAEVDEALKRYGTPLSLPLMVQREAALARLTRFAEREVEDRMEGWSIREVEVAIGKEQYPWTIHGQPVSMQIDRIDEHPRLGMRVLDYKSSSRADTPEGAHLRPYSDNRRTYGPLLITSGRHGEKVWKNVQLPLYAAFLNEHFELRTPPVVGYVNLPATLNDISISIWKSFDESILRSALEWTHGAIDALTAGVHWPPVELSGQESRLDDFAGLAPDGFKAAAAGSLIEHFKVSAGRYNEERSFA